MVYTSVNLYREAALALILSLVVGILAALVVAIWMLIRRSRSQSRETVQA